MKKITLLLLCLFSFQFYSAQEINFPDQNLKDALLNHNPIIDTNQDNEIQISEAAALTGLLYLRYKQVSDVTGLENFVNITELNLKYNELDSFSITSLLNLQNLNLDYNDLTTLDLSGFTSLEHLGIFANDLGALTDSMLPQTLTYLDVKHNNLTEFSSASLTSLEYLDVSQNNISSLNIAGLSALTELDFSANVMTSLSGATLPESLTSIRATHNQISTLSISSLTNVETLDLSSNSLTAISDSNLPPQLEELILSQNQIQTVNLNSLANLEILSLANNSLVSFASNVIPQSLSLLNLRGNDLTSIDLSSNTGLISLDTSNNPLTSLDVSNNPNLEFIGLMDMMQLEYLNLKNGNNENMSSVEPFYQMENVEYVCVDSAEVFFSNLYMEEWMGEPWFTVSSNCEFGEDQLNMVTGTVKYDIGAGCNDDSAVVIPNMLVTSQVGLDEYATLTTQNGDYTLYTNEGLNTLATTSENANFEFDPATQDISFTGFNNQATADFCAQANGEVNDASLVLLPIGNAVPGFSSNYQIVITNQGTTDLDGEILLTYNENLQTFTEASPSENIITNNTLSFTFTDLAPFQSDYINVEFLNAQPPTLTSGDILDFNVEIIPSATDDNLENNEFILDQEVVNSYDPNDKRVLEGSQVHIDNAGKYLNYIIRFQNTGTANAQKVAIRDTLSDNLDWSSLKMISASDDYYVNIVNGNAVEFVFNDINLPFEDADEEGSQGFIAYKIKPKAGIAIGEVMAGDAAIYFDFNAPIITNMVSTEIVNNLKVASEEFSAQIQLYPNPVNEVLHIQNNSAKTIESVEVFSITGQLLFSRRNSEEINMSQLNTGIYFVKLITSEGISVTKKVVKK